MCFLIINSNFAPKYSDMYTKITQQITIGDIYCIPYEYVPNKEDCNSLFNINFADDNIVLYTQIDGKIVFLGYVIIDHTHISKSVSYDFFVKKSINIGHINPTETLSNMGCVHIAEWKFDETLRQKDKLTSIFNTIITAYSSEEQKLQLWCDGRSDLIFYPIEKVCDTTLPSAVLYFTNAFLNE